MKFKDVINSLNILKLNGMANCLSDYVDKTGANLLFQLLAKRYKKCSTIITSNQQFPKWGEVLLDTTLAFAILDRLLHPSYVFNITANSFRIKDDYNVFHTVKNHIFIIS